MEIQRIEITENDKTLLSVFMGEEYPIIIDFNWLMPVWFKIQAWGLKEFGVCWEQSIGEKFIKISTTKIDKYKIMWLSDGKVEDVWYVVVDFIKWYNTQKQ